MSTIMRVVCDEFDVTEEQIKGNNRINKFIIPRFAFYYLSYKYGHSYKRIGMWLNDRDHTTVLHGKRRATQYLGEDRLNKLDSQIQILNNKMYHQQGEQ